ncbi:Uncharacterised protein [[Clostridium] sordellii]|uniref:hypothetical protein n=1 Tax=Paraclostridium sordellii TaxID=1505 RepID=UPI0005E0C927|nr:hypothetical protein [Paeniclostridium sordellii]CEN74607.1 Uncharacterised protein [[Clostridium] sordellii] [Paeniclostridium sordellii]
MNIYNLGQWYIESIPLDDDLDINEIIFTLEVEGNTIYTLEYRGYEGYMARYDRNNNCEDKPKLGYFDFRIRDRFGNLITHRELLERLLEFSTLEHCYNIWQGYNVEEVAHNQEEAEVLTGLALCMLEQEINWGTRSWQKFTHFRNRGRDMIMGFIVHAFDIGINHIPHWNGSTPTFGGSFYRYDYPQYFTFEANPQPILSGDILREFNRKIQS